MLNSQVEEEKLTDDQPQFNLLSPRQKNITFVLICLSDLVTSMSYTYLIPFYPDIAANKAGLSYGQIGSVFTMMAIGNVIFSIPIGKLVTKFGRKLNLSISLVIQIISMVMIGSVEFFTSQKYLFYGLSLISRTLQGFGRTQFKICVFAYINIFWPKKFQKMFSYNDQTAAQSTILFYQFYSLGFALGPLVGTVLNYFLGFSFPLFLLSFLVLVMFICLMFYVPSDAQIKSEFIQAENGQKVSILKVLHYKIFILLLLILVAMGSLAFGNSFLVNHMASFKIGKNVTAAFIFLPTLSFIFFQSIVPRLSAKIMKQFTISLGLLLAMIGACISQPFWGLCSSAAPAVVGLVIMGGAQPFFRVPSIPLFKEMLLDILKKDKATEEINQMASSLFTLGIGLPNLVMPVLAGNIYDFFGGNVDGKDEPIQEEKAYRHSFQILTLMQLTVFLLFLIFGNGYKGWVDTFKKITGQNQEQQDETKINLINETVISDSAAKSEKDNEAQ